MRSSDKPEFLKLVSDVHAFYRQPVSEFTLAVWWEACHSFELEQVRKALSGHATDPDRGQFAPKPADVVRLLRGTTVDRAAVAWGMVMQAISSAGAYQDVDFGDPATHAAIHDMGGWPKVCRSDLKELGFVQHRFTEAHRAYSARGVASCPLVLAGDRSPDAEYEKRGLPIPKPVLIGKLTCATAMRQQQRIGNEAIARIEEGFPA